ncbi:MAG: exosortase/archaeosortase family protein [Candidatus Methanoperedens sp.]|nr:exosortase/archaeosortase family protein [Candidatus Methanoperedens sp.]
MAFIAAFGIFYFDTFSWLAGSWINNEYYSHGFLVPIISGYIIWTLRKELALVERRQSQTGLGIIAFGILLQGIGVLWSIRFISGISLLVTGSGMILYLFGWEFLKKISFPLVFLVLMIPLPIVDIIASPTQMLSAIGTTSLANLAGLPVVREGLILKIPSGSFEVAYACSGINSIISLFTIAVIYAFILEGGMLMKFTIIISSIPLALAGNIMRITSVLAVANKYGQETAMNYFHDFSSLLLFCVVLSGLFLIGRCFGRLRFKKIF